MTEEPLIPPSALSLLKAERKLLIALTAIQRELAKHGVPSLEVEGRPLSELFAGQTAPDLSANAGRSARSRSRGHH